MRESGETRGGFLIGERSFDGSVAEGTECIIDRFLYFQTMVARERLPREWLLMAGLEERLIKNVPLTQRGL